jgi:hypothetical protein
MAHKIRYTDKIKPDGIDGTERINIEDSRQRIWDLTLQEIADLVPPASPGVFGITGGVTSNEGGTYATDDFVFGSPSLNDDTDSTHDRRMFFDKSSASFRAGMVTGTAWNTRGNYSAAFGEDTSATGSAALAFGSFNSAVGSSSFAGGDSSTANGANSIAIGDGCTADGNESVAFGTSSEADGINSFCMGDTINADGNSSAGIGSNLTAASFAEVIVGCYGVIRAAGSTTAHNSADAAFAVGIGTGAGAKADGLVVYKHGGVFMPGLKSGVDQAGAGAAAGEIYIDTDDNTLKVGV